MIELNDRYEECSECPVKEDCVFNRIVLRDPNGIYMKCPCRYCLVVIMCNEGECYDREKYNNAFHDVFKSR